MLREIMVEKSVWEARRLVATGDDWLPSHLVDASLPGRASSSLEHVFNVLSLAFPERPLRMALAALHTDDPIHHGAALEYLENLLSRQVRAHLWPFLEADPWRKSRGRPREAIVAELVRDHESIRIRLGDPERKG